MVILKKNTDGAVMVLNGGVRQQLGLDKKRSLDDCNNTNTGQQTPSEFLGKLYKKGKIAATDVVEGCKASSSVGGNVSKVDPNCASWANSSAQHASRNLLSKLAREKSGTACDLYAVKAPFWDRVKNKSYTGLLYFLLPFEVLDQLIIPGKIPSYCDYSNPALNTKFEAWLERTHITRTDNFVALGVWGDSAPYSNRDSLQLMLYNAISSDDRTRTWFTCFPNKVKCNCGCKGRHTYDVVWEVMGWVLDCMAAGKRPHARHDGVEFSASHLVGDKKRARLASSHPNLRLRAWAAQKRGDWAWYKQGIALGGWGGEGRDKRVCLKCMANKTDVPFTDFSLLALWRSTVIGNVDFMLHLLFAGGYKSGLHDLYV